MNRAKKIKEDLESCVLTLIFELVNCKANPWYSLDRETPFRIYETMYEIAAFGKCRDLISADDILNIIKVAYECKCIDSYEKKRKRFGSIPEEWKDIYKISSKEYIDSFIKECIYYREDGTNMNESELTDIQLDIEAYLLPYISELIRCKLYSWWASDRETQFLIYEYMHKIAAFGDYRKLVTEDRVMLHIETAMIITVRPFYPRCDLFGSIPEEWKDIYKISSKKYIDSFIEECKNRKD